MYVAFIVFLLLSKKWCYSVGLDCPNKAWACLDGDCLDKEYVCNGDPLGFPHCDDNSDEDPEMCAQWNCTQPGDSYTAFMLRNELVAHFAK